MPLRVCHGVSNDNIGGRGRLRRPEIVLQQEQTSVNSLSPVESLTPANSLSTVSMTPVITLFPGVVDTGKK